MAEGTPASDGPFLPSASAIRTGGWPDPALRVGDVERAAVADQLSRHFSDGRLDQAEFEARMDKALRAKTVSDLSGLLDDLPGSRPVPLSALSGSPFAPQAVPQPGGRRYQRRLMNLELERQRILVRRERHALRRERRRANLHTLAWAVIVGASVLAVFLAIRAISQWIVAFLVVGVIVALLIRRGK